LERFLHLCEGLSVKWERLHFDSMSRGMKRKEGNDEGEGNKKARGESSGYKPLMIASVGSTARVASSRATSARHVT
jgi:hypothetical protein